MFINAYFQKKEKIKCILVQENSTLCNTLHRTIFFSAQAQLKNLAWEAEK